MFHKILIANRGEIACRVAQSCRRLGVGTVAVYSDADAHGRHVELCDQAVRLGPAPARDSYLDGARVIAAAVDSGAEAVHPGYGFLSENAGFAEACERAGLTFIGPPPAAIRAMGSKSAAKAIMQQAGVPLVPGYHGDDQDPATLAAAADAIGYPLLIKASAGGGGKGMRVVETAAGFEAALAGARREAAAAFGDDRVLLEKYLLRPRHVEVQVFADRHGNTVHLFERDCSVQRRYQKIIEEAPAPGLGAEQRRALGEKAVAAARAVAYVGAGTVEFIMENDENDGDASGGAGGRFYFMEMNTRLQVEHPVTEMITGQDLVEWQLRVAAGEPLPLAQEQLRLNGHAFEARVYAEDPARDFLPSTGRLNHLRTPTAGPRVRIDSGVAEGDEITVHYDPMIAKLITWGEDRGRALRGLGRALAAYQVVGVATNLELLAAIAGHPAFAAGAVHTGFIPEHAAELFAAVEPDDHVVALVSLGALLLQTRQTQAQAAQSADPWSPWHAGNGWRLNGHGRQILTWQAGEHARQVTACYLADPGYYLLELGPEPGSTRLTVSGRLDADGGLLARIGQTEQRTLKATLARQDGRYTLFHAGRRHDLTLLDPLVQAAGEQTGHDSLTAPMPGTIIEVRVSPGAVVAQGDTLLVLEAMKMEHNITAPHAGTVDAVNVAVGDPVQEGVELLTLNAE